MLPTPGITPDRVRVKSWRRKSYWGSGQTTHNHVQGWWRQVCQKFAVSDADSIPILHVGQTDLETVNTLLSQGALLESLAGRRDHERVPPAWWMTTSQDYVQQLYRHDDLLRAQAKELLHSCAAAFHEEGTDQPDPGEVLWRTLWAVSAAHRDLTGKEPQTQNPELRHAPGESGGSAVGDDCTKVSTRRVA